MENDFILKLEIGNLLYLNEKFEQSLLLKESNEIVNYMKKLENQKKHVKNNDEFDLINKQYALLDKILISKLI